MRTIVKGKNIDVPDNIRAYAERKMSRLERILDDRSEALVELSVEQHRSHADSRIVEVTLVIDGKPLRTHAAAPTHRAGIDEVVDKLERRAVDHREKPRVRARPVEEKAILHARRRHRGAGRERRIVKEKRFAIEPMFEEDAVARMDELGHRSSSTSMPRASASSILYARDDGDLGLIEPMVGGEYTKGRSRSNGRH